jgi:predicted DCC family thiol-disulfide oxidoreductase YuxK
MTPQLRDQCRKAVVILTSHGEKLTAGQACAFALEQVGYRTLGRVLRWPVFRTIVEWGYRWVARNRRWLGRILFRKSATL